MFKRNNRKGFTLAELLIVVAIIAVLVAIAVPLFVGALNDAETRVGEANKRAVRGLAVEKILLTDSLLYKTPAADATGARETYDNWSAKAIVGANGEVKALEVKAGESVTEEATKDASGKGKVDGKDVGKGDYYVAVNITELKVNNTLTKN